MTVDTGVSFAFPALAGRKVTAAFDGGRLSSDGGVMLLAAAARRMGIAGKLAAANPDRLENTPDLRNLSRLGRVMVDLYCASYPAPPEAIGLGIDDTVDIVHGHQQLSLFNAHHDKWLFRRHTGCTIAQFLGHADTIVAMPQYRGEPFSFGDGKIMRIHRRAEGQGNLETWITIGVNHHIAGIVGQPAILPWP